MIIKKEFLTLADLAKFLGVYIEYDGKDFKPYTLTYRKVEGK